MHLFTPYFHFSFFILNYHFYHFFFFTIYTILDKLILLNLFFFSYSSTSIQTYHIMYQQTSFSSLFLSLTLFLSASLFSLYLSISVCLSYRLSLSLLLFLSMFPTYINILGDFIDILVEFIPSAVKLYDYILSVDVLGMYILKDTAINILGLCWFYVLNLFILRCVLNILLI